MQKEISGGSELHGLRVALVGFGGVATYGHLPTYNARPDIRVVAVVDPHPSRREAALALISDVKVYEQLAELLQDSHEDFDIVDICSPPAFHAVEIEQALLANKHVLCEKPLVLHSSELDALMQLALVHQRILYPCHNYKFAPSLSFASHLIHHGRIGTPLLGTFQVFRVECASGVTEWKSDWRRTPDIAGGGIMVDHGSHMIYMAQNFFGSPPKQVSAHMSNLRYDKKLVEDTALFSLDFGESIVHTSLTWVASTRRSSLLFHGTCGELQVEDDVIILTECDKPVRYYRLASAFNDRFHSAWFHDLFLDFEQHLKDRNLRPSALLEAVVVTDVIEQAYRSSDQGGIWLPIHSV